MSHDFSQVSRYTQKTIRTATVAVIVAILLVPLAVRCFETVPAGHVKVATLFGKIQDDPFEEGMHFPVNPFYAFHQYDARQKTHMETANVPSQDQLNTKIDVSVQYRVIKSKASEILRGTGTAAEAVNVHLVPLLRSGLREQGKSIKRAEDFFLEETQQKLQLDLLTALQPALAKNGIEVNDVLIRDIALPARLIKQIEEKKEAEQQAERMKATLAEFTTEQEKQVVEAEANRRAAEEDAKRQMVLADALAYEIEAVNKAIAENPAYVQLEALKALQMISKDPAAKMYFLNGDSPMPLPLMNMGEPLIRAKE